MGGWTYNRSVKFKNGNTEGEQNFSGTSSADVITKIEAFIKQLEGE